MSKITKIEFQKNNKNRVNIFIDGEFFLGCYTSLVYKFSLENGMDIDKDRLIEVISEEEYESCKEKALRSISRAEKSEKSMREKLSVDFSEKAVDRVIDFLKKYSLIDDERFAERLVLNDQNFKRVGKNKIKQNLYIKGIDRNQIEESMSLIDEEKELENAIYLAEKKLKKIKETDERIIRNKIFQHLSYKGFSYNMINSALRRILEKDNF